MPRESPFSPWTAGDVHVRRVRGPRVDGLVYWRAEVKTAEGARLVWAGWGVRNDRDLVRQLVDGARQVTRDAEHPPATTVRALLGAWKAHQRQRADARSIKESSWTVYACQIKRLSRGLGDVLTDRVDRDLLTRYQRDRLEAGVATRTVTDDLIGLSMAWRWGHERGIVDHPISLPDAPKPKRARSSYTPTAAEVLAVMEHATPPWVRAALALLLGTGARLGEVAGLTWASVDVERGVVTFDQKTGPRTVPLSADVLRELGQPGTPGEYVIGRVTLVRGSLQSQIRKACKRAKLPAWSPHALRRLACDTLYSGKVDPGTAGAMLGHSPAIALKHYRKPREQDLRTALEATGLGRIPEGVALSFPSQKRVTGTGGSDGEP